jgi:probable rRNA maturation factor
VVAIDARGPGAQVKAAARARLRKRLERAMAAAGMADRELALSLVGDAEIHELNRDFREVDKPTDVLSFSMVEGEGGGLHPQVMGDVVISVETAGRQAAEAGRTLEEELLRLAVHGFVHLCGYDHATADEERRMFGWEAELRAHALAGEK